MSHVASMCKIRANQSFPAHQKKKTLLKGNNLCPLEKKNQKEGHSYSP